MPHWETELEQLLSSLGVSLEERPNLSASRMLAHADFEPTDLTLTETDDQSDTDTDDEELRIVNQEVEATVREVARLVRSGRLEPALRDDVVRVLGALSRPGPGDGLDRAEWEITSAAAVLHFCRIVLRLANVITLLDRS